MECRGGRDGGETVMLILLSCSSAPRERCLQDQPEHGRISATSLDNCRAPGKISFCREQLKLVNNASTLTIARACCPAVTIRGVCEFHALASAPMPLPVPAAEWRLTRAGFPVAWAYPSAMPIATPRAGRGNIGSLPENPSGTATRLIRDCRRPW